MLEKQFRRFFKEAARIPGPIGVNLLQLPERRLGMEIK
jgi:ribosomal protein S4